MRVSRRGLFLGAVSLALSPRAVLAAGPAAPVVTFAFDAPALDLSGRSAPYRPAPARAVTLPDEAYAWRPFL